VKVLCIEPGFFKTAVTDSSIFETHIQRLWKRLPEEVKEEYGSDFIDKSEFKSNNQLQIANKGHKVTTSNCVCSEAGDSGED